MTGDVANKKTKIINNFIFISCLLDINIRPESIVAAPDEPHFESAWSFKKRSGNLYNPAIPKHIIIMPNIIKKCPI